MDKDREEQQHRLRNREKSDAAKLAWKRHHASYMQGTRKRERDMENKTFYSLAQDLNKLSEESIIRNNEFTQQADFSFDTIAGGISCGINNDKISFSCSLDETGSGSYSLQNGNISDIYKSITEDLQNICKMVDDEMRQVLAKYGLKSTK